MNLNDLLVSYKQVETPSYLQEQIEQPTELEVGESTDQEALNRVQSRQGFAGWKSMETSNQPIKDNNVAQPIKGQNAFNQAMNSYLSKHPEDAKYRDTLTAIANKESNFNPTVKNSASSASGYFQFIDSTRKQYAPNLTRDQFLNSPEEQISAAVKLLKANRKISSKYSNVRGLNQLQIDYGMWFSPKALSNYLKTGKSDFKDPQGTSLMQVLRKMA